MRKSLINSGAMRKYIIYAIGEIVLVVVGILIALQINNWNEYRKSRKIEEKILVEVVKNLESNIVRLQTNIDQNTYDNISTDFILSVIDDDLSYADSLDRYFPSALNPVDIGSLLSYTGYESLKNTGFNIVSDDLLQQEIITLFEETYQELEARYDRLEDSRKAVGSFTRDHFYRASAAYEFTPIDFDDLVQNKQFYSWLNSIKGYRAWVSVALLESIDETKRVLQLVKQKLDYSDE